MSNFDLSKSSEENNFTNPVFRSNSNRHVVYPELSDSSIAVTSQEENGIRKGGKDGDGESSSSKDGEDGGKKEKPVFPMVGVGEIFKFSTCGERLLMVIGIICAAAHGAAMPIMIIVFGNMSNSFISAGAYEQFLEDNIPVWQERCANLSLFCGNVTKDYILDDPNPPSRLIQTCAYLLSPPGCDITTSEAPTDTLINQMKEYSIYYIILGCCVLVVGYAQVITWQNCAYNQTQRIRMKLLHSILRQEIGWFDTHEIGELNTRLSDDVLKIEAGIGEKIGLFFQYIATFVAGIIIGFVYSWKLTLVILAVSPLLVMSGMAMGRLGASMTSKELLAYAKAGAIAEEVFGGIRTVMAFGGEGKECARYNNNLLEAKDFGIKKGMLNGISMGLIFLVMFGSYALGFWYGSKLVYKFEIEPGDLLIVFFCVLIGTFNIGNAAPNIQNFAMARGAAYVIFGIIASEPKIDSASKEGKKDSSINGNVVFHDVHFKYPSRPDVPILQGLSIKVNVGQTVALVGSSGCGKSTTVQLIQRFYDPEEGKVTMDGTDIREFNVKWLRQQIGVVNQEPVLFGTTIGENIRYGQDGVSQDDIVRACREANAHDFISKLPKQYDTLVGERGAQLSGGQKQRIAIARALVKNPKILLLDEATSALDTESEATVQAALDSARQGRTTLVIAHRLSTVRNADVIVGVKDGKVIEQGSHDELMAKKGLYFDLVTNQEMDDTEDNGYEAIPMKPELDRAVSFRNSDHKMKRGVSVMSSGSGQMDRMVSHKGEEEKLPDAELSRIMRMNSPEWPLLLGGCFCSIIVGGVQPCFAIVFSDILGIYAESGPHVQDKINLYSGMFAVIGVGAGLGMAGQGICFSRAGEQLTLRLRKLAFQTILKQDVAYFDDSLNSVGALCTRLATDASAVQGATGSRLGMFCQALASIGAGIIIGFVYSWELTLLIIGFAPFLLGSGFVQMKVLSGNKGDKKLEAAGKIAIEAIENIRTVATLTKEEKFIKDYEIQTIVPFKKDKRTAHIQAFAFGFSQTVMFFANAACFQLGSFLIVNRGLSFQNMFRVFSAVVFGAVAAGQASSFAPDYGKAKNSAAKIFALFDRVPSIDSSDPNGKKPSYCNGSITLRDIHFNYPSRPNVTVLRGLDLKVDPGQTVALVGSSGCGKSTTVQLLERFYDPLQGDLCIDNEETKELNIQWMRSQMGIVSQEPVLFDCSIGENIAYGDNSRQVSMAEIIEAAKNANIHSFIESLPEGYETNVGDKGAQLSGGQKQRVAIARALVRNPKILLLDEATSALDTESEKVVQAALDRAQEGRTCIVIAHRLSTIQNADCIMVIHQGKVVEKGKHQELLQQRGRYYKLNNAQLKKS